MTTLTSIATPPVLNNVCQSLFVQVAASHGCGEDLYIAADQCTIRCRKQCIPCKSDIIKADYDRHVNRLIKRTALYYFKELIHYRLFARVPRLR